MRLLLVFLFASSVAAAEPVRFVVTTAADDGAGSLRQAILDVNSRCAAGSECAIAFEGVQAIRPLTPLPAIEARGRVSIDGGDARVVLDGSALGEGSGLELRPHDTVMLRNLVVDRFPGDGIQAVSADVLSLWLKNVACTHNRYRGFSQVGTPFTTVVLDDSAFDDNGYSGVALWSAGFVFTERSSFSGNGASGLFLLDVKSAGVGSDVLDDNAHFGIAIATPSNVVVYASNEIRRNRVRNVDYGLDGESPRGTPGLPGAPEILSASYNSDTGKTTVRAVLHSPPNDYAPYAAYASAGELEPDGTAGVGSGGSSETLFFPNDVPHPERFEFTITLDHAPPGSWVSIWGAEFVNYPLTGRTTELSRAVMVE